jgi:hypothetical protein
MKIKVERMMKQKRAKQGRKLLNNPPKKETLLKGSKDGDRDGPQRYTKPGEFGFL